MGLIYAESDNLKKVLLAQNHVELVQRNVNLVFIMMCA